MEKTPIHTAPQLCLGIFIIVSNFLYFIYIYNPKPRKVMQIKVKTLITFTETL